MKKNISFPKVTVSFPVYNAESYIFDSLSSVIDQDYSNIEILVIDDFGKDGSMKIATDLLKSSKRDYQIISFGKNKKQGYGRNYSIENAEGKYLFFMDSDDRLSSNAISKLVEYGERYNSDLVIGSFFKEDSNGAIAGITYTDVKQLVGKHSLLKAMYSDNIFISVFMWNKLYKLSFLKKEGIFCEHPYIEDDLFSFKVMLKSVNSCLIPDITYFYNTENLNSTTKVSMHSKDMSLETGRIHSEIVAAKYKSIIRLPESKMRNKILMEVLGTGIFHFYFIKKSKYILKEQEEQMSQLILSGIPNINFSISKELSFKENVKNLYYFFFTKAPLWLRIFWVKFFNDSWYKLTIK
jgi:glycosyltransferase involved in cell wall biosynthesis